MTKDPTNKNFDYILLLNRGQIWEKIGDNTKAFDDYSAALKINENSSNVLYLRANIHFKRGEFEDCIIDCEAAITSKASEKAKKLIKSAKTSLLSKPKENCYTVLGISSTSSSSEIKKAYRKLSLIVHPDKAPGDATAVDKAKLARKFRDVKEAHDVATAKSKN